MLTQKEKEILIGLINNVPISGNRQQILKVMEELDVLARKVEALEVEEETKPQKTPVE